MPRILVADDNRVTAMMVAHLLREAGHEVLSARDGDEALRLAARERPDLLVLDVLMPELDGFEVVRRLREDPALEPIPVILLTGKSQQQDLELGLAAGADEYLVKPFRPVQLLKHVDRLIGAARAGRR